MDIMRRGTQYHLPNVSLEPSLRVGKIRARKGARPRFPSMNHLADERESKVRGSHLLDHTRMIILTTVPANESTVANGGDSNASHELYFGLEQPGF